MSGIFHDGADCTGWLGLGRQRLMAHAARAGIDPVPCQDVGWNEFGERLERAATQFDLRVDVDDRPVDL